MRRYLFTTDHRMVGLQYFWLSLVAALAGVLLSVLMRFHLTSPGTNLPFLGVMTPELYLSLMTIHGTLMVFFVLSVAPQNAFGHFVLPLQLGSGRMAFPLLGSLSFWLTAASLVLLFAAAFAPGGGPLSGWTAYPPLSAIGAVAGPGQGSGQTLWIVSIAVFCVASTLSAINFIATILECRRSGTGLMQLPLTCWNWLVTALLSLLGFPVLLAAGVLLLLDRTAGTSFFIPGGLLVNERLVPHDGGSPLLWQHLFWFFGHPEVYIAILPGMGLVSEVLATFSGKPIFGRTMMIVATFAIGFLGLLVWGHHMFTSGMSPYSSIAFSVLTMTIGVPSAVKTFNWLGTLWRGRIRFTTAMLFALGFVSIFVTGGLSGIFLGQPVLDLYLHDTYFVVAHFHLIMGVAAIFGIFAATFYWFPLLFGRMLNETLGKLHFAATFVGVYCLFLPMHIAGVAGNPRRYPDFTNFEFLTPLLSLHRLMTWAALFTAAAQLLFLFNFFHSLRRGQRAPVNPWSAETPEWKDVPAGNTGEAAFTGTAAVLAAATMLFAAFASAYIVRRGISSEWTALRLPPALLWSVLPGLGASLAAAYAPRSAARSVPRLGAVFGAIFIALHAQSWPQIAGQSTAAGAFFLVMDAALVMAASGAVILLVASRRPSRATAAAPCWHYINAVWVLMLALAAFRS